MSLFSFLMLLVSAMSTGPAKSATVSADKCICFVERMAPFAMCCTVFLRRQPVAAKNVLSQRHWLQVLRIHAQPISAKMVETWNVGHRTKNEKVGNAVRELFAAVNKCAVSIAVLPSGPLPASAIGFGNSFQKIVHGITAVDIVAFGAAKTPASANLVGPSKKFTSALFARKSVFHKQTIPAYSTADNSAIIDDLQTLDLVD